MDVEKKKEYKERIVAANRSELIVIMYEMIFSYMEDFYREMKSDSWQEAKVSLDRIEAIVRRLQDDLNIKYDVAKELYSLYDFCIRHLSMARSLKSEDKVRETEKILRNLYKGMCEMSKEDKSEPLMQNKESVYLGMTYGKGSLNEISMGIQNRGFYA
ncbi:MAG: flagellar protein FliS [Lachnospiraceae bacterium]|nr:flagellar protein FliS [Lachnospiraceae bacterium]